MQQHNEIVSRMASFRQEIGEEISIAAQYQPTQKDILIVVHNQLDYLEACIDSIQKNTKDYKIFIWDNNSDKDTQNWIRRQKHLTVVRSEENLGFIVPNNSLAKLGVSPYLILLNSDTLVFPGWDAAMIAHHQQKKLAQVGYLGGFLDRDGKGCRQGFGASVDYITGWCFSLDRHVYDQIGLFDDENLEFAYGEDSDLSLRIREAGHSIYALHLGLVHHFGNRTIKEVAKTRDCRKSFDANHLYIAKRWAKFLPDKPLGST